MCGIFAVVGERIDQNAVERALGTLQKRGPDDRGILPFDGCTLAQTRLSIVDLSDRGHQPMKDRERPLSITFNGEIYGYKELRKELESKGHRFQSDSDTETILKAYAEYGTKCVHGLDGMFAIALWDERDHSLFLARDRFGKKPLYYAYDDAGRLVIASEVKAMVAYGITPRLSNRGIDAYLALMYLPPWMTAYENIHTLPPGHYATYRNGALSISRYWSITDAPDVHVSYDEAKEEVRRLLDSAVKRRMVADVEVGAFLSGGVDSTLITAYAQRYMDRPIKTFSIGYGEHINELPFAAEAARVIGTDHHTEEVDATLTDVLEDVMAYMDEPHADSADLAQSVVSRFARQSVKVALSGDGGDELFMGYGTYWAYYNRPKIVALKNMLFSTQLREHMKSITMLPPRMRRSLMLDPVFNTTHFSYVPEEMRGHTHTDERAINLFDLTTTLPGMFLTKVDRMSMMHGLEVRSPLLDYRLAEFAYRLPTSHKMDHRHGKLLLKDLLAEVMPRSFVDRKKQGFGAPVRKWLQEPRMREYVTNLFKDPASAEYFVRDELISFVARTLGGNNQKDYYRLWILVCFEVWVRKHSSFASARQS